METTVDPRHAHPRELVRGLMRGNRAEQKLGYSATNAVIAATNVGNEETEAAITLQAYAEGFAAGMQEDPAKTLPAGVESGAEEREELEAEDVTKPFVALLDEIGDKFAEKFQPGVIVRQKSAFAATQDRALTGEIIEADFSDTGRKPLTVRTTDGGLKYFHLDQVEVVSDDDAAEIAEELDPGDPTLTPKFHMDVVSELTAMGLKATYEYPGMVSIDRGDGTSVDTGQHGWHYGSIRDGDGDPAGQQEIERFIPAEKFGTTKLTPREVAAAWYEAIEGVSPVAGITPAQLRAIARSVENMNRGGIGAGSGEAPIACLGINVKPIREAEIDGGDGDVLATFSYQPVDAEGTQRQVIGREETCFARNGDVRWSQDCG